MTQQSLSQTAAWITKAPAKLRVRFKCPVCYCDKVVASTWCWECLTFRNEWLRVGLWWETYR